MKDNRTYLDISDCIERIEQYTAAGKEAFLTNSMLQDATLFIQSIKILRTTNSNQTALLISAIPSYPN